MANVEFVRDDYPRYETCWVCNDVFVATRAAVRVVSTPEGEVRTHFCAKCRRKE